jgi:anthranilate/para-aminobenzoate synthase component II
MCYIDPMLVAFIDHYDSFSLNIVDWLINSGFIVEYYRYDEPGLVDYLTVHPRPLVISPGPFTPLDYPESLRLISSLEGIAPVLGICLGFQMLGILHSARIAKVSNPFHGSPQLIEWKDTGERRNFQTIGISYNSLHLQLNHCGTDVEALASNSSGEIQCARFFKPGMKFPSLGVQFHPESFAGDQYDFLLSDFDRQVRAFGSQELSDSTYT